MQVGDKIYLIRLRGDIDEHKITKIGRKWFYADRLKFSIKTRREDTAYGSSQYAYSSLQEIEEEKERNRIGRFIEEKFRYYNPNLSLESFRKIEQIIKSED